MKQRIKNIIQREKIKRPNLPGILLLFERVLQVVKFNIRNVQLKVRKDGTFSSTDELQMCSLFPQKVLDIIIKEKRYKTVLDVGCGTGVSLKYLLKHGIDAVGVENSKIAISHSEVKDKIIKYNLNKELNLNRRFDCVWSFEVIEHIHPKYEANFLRSLVNHSSTIIISGARPGQGGYGHFNEQEPEYWILKFKELNYEIDQNFSQELRKTGDNYSDNLLCFNENV